MLDLKDRKILYELSCNARMLTKALAKKIGLSESSTVYRLKRMYEQKIILGTSAIVDSYKLGYEGYRVYFKFYATTPDNENEIIDWLIKQKSVTILGLCEGEADVIIHTWIKVRKNFEEMIYEFKRKYGDFITDLRIDLYVGAHHFTKRHFLDKTSDDHVITIGGNGVADCDSLDLKIIETLNADARKSVLQIAKLLKKPASTITSRLRNLEKKKIILGYAVNINYEKLDLEYYKLGFILVKKPSEQKLISLTSSIPQSVYMDKSLSDFDFEINLELKTHQELIDVIRRIKNELGGIRKIFTYRLVNYLKFTYLS
ncbi:Lrp/AsnC family transcriptional regulator [Candidatus Woesearchaeota archaeon]|nr:Lrp/AsnC family transcriptional regulator [Candidatus Woesearchaeota archaeon]